MFRLKQLFKLKRLTRNSNYYTVQSDKSVNDENFVAKQIYSKIKSTGPITIAEYMKQVLIDPTGGYYMNKDMLGPHGDFVTSPELGQMFGEMIAIWFLNEWSKIGSPKPFQIVELGPGRGTLSQDILRVFKHFDCLIGGSLNLVEISPTLSQIQATRLCPQSDVINDPASPIYRKGSSWDKVPINWFKNYSDIPNIFTLLIAHEFFDALPVHKFNKTDLGYREVLIDIDLSHKSDLKFRYISAKEDTPASKMFINRYDNRNHIEISPESLILIEEICGKFEKYGGLGLIADYGHNGEGGDTFRAFKKHQQHDPLIQPGSADLTADVDFSELKKITNKHGGVITVGPIPQNQFLRNMGIEQRFEVLTKNCDSKNVEGLEYGYKMMLDDDKMGKKFKFLALLPSVLEDLLKKYPPVGFS